MTEQRSAPIELAPGIIADPAVCHGKPVVKGTRVPAALLVGKVAGGMAIAEVADAYGISEDGVRAALGYAAMMLEEEEARALP
jgi:uncharacterized protein (DUF433 family)